jgi:hypothetical protein
MLCSTIKAGKQRWSTTQKWLPDDRRNKSKMSHFNWKINFERLTPNWNDQKNIGRQADKNLTSVRCCKNEKIPFLAIDRRQNEPHRINQVLHALFRWRGVVGIIDSSCETDRWVPQDLGTIPQQQHGCAERPRTILLFVFEGDDGFKSIVTFLEQEPRDFKWGSRTRTDEHKIVNCWTLTWFRYHKLQKVRDSWIYTAQNVNVPYC